MYDSSVVQKCQADCDVVQLFELKSIRNSNVICCSRSYQFPLVSAGVLAQVFSDMTELAIRRDQHGERTTDVKLAKKREDVSVFNSVPNTSFTIQPLHVLLDLDVHDRVRVMYLAVFHWIRLGGDFQCLENDLHHVRLMSRATTTQWKLTRTGERSDKTSLARYIIEFPPSQIPQRPIWTRDSG